MIKFQKQAFKHDPDNGTYGDCHRTVIACMLGMDRDDVPHWGVHYDDWVEFDKCAEQFIKSMGFRLLKFNLVFHRLEDCLSYMGSLNPGIHYMLTGTSRNGVHHIVICKDDKIVWDTALDDSGIVGPCSDGQFVIEFLVADKDYPVK